VPPARRVRLIVGLVAVAAAGVVAGVVLATRQDVPQPKIQCSEQPLPLEMRADEILHPQFFAPQDGLYPLFEPTGTDPLLLRGVVLQRAGHQHSAERLYARAARLHRASDEAQVAAAVGRFDEDDLSAAFSRLGPLVRRFPRSQSVRYHLGLLLAWTGQREQATAEFRLARSQGPKTRLGREADTFLRGLVSSGTKTTQR
jgi:hypothetical protein